MKVLVLWSGGVESTSLLLHLLRDTADEIVAHHIVEAPAEGWHEMQTRAIAALLPHLQAIRPFKFSRSFVPRPSGNYGVAVAALTLRRHVALALRRYGCERIYRARCLEDQWTCRAAPSGIPWPDLDLVAPYLDHYGHAKAWHLRFLGPTLAPMTWSCRWPEGGRPCGRCLSCRQRAAAIAGTSAIPEIAAMLAVPRASDEGVHALAPGHA